MSKTLSLSLEAEEPAFSQRLSEWERKSGQPSHDVRLVSDISNKVKQSIKLSDLDEYDTTPKELYYSLLHRVKQDNDVIAGIIGINSQDSPHTSIEKIVKWVSKLELQKELWVIKNSVVKSYLKKRPPKLLMKSLGFRSVDSMLKRCDPSDLIGIASIVEKHDWLEKLHNNYSNLQPKDFHEEKATIHIIEPEKIKKLRDNGLRTTRIITPCYETGVIVLLTPIQRFQNDVLTITVTLLETIADMRRRSAYLRLISTHTDFGKKVSLMSSHGLKHASENYHGLHWNPLHRHLVGNEEFISNLEQPHLSHLDLMTHNTPDVLAQYDPRFDFWKNQDHVIYALDGHQPVSLHLADVSINASNQVDFENSAKLYAQHRLHEKLWGAYLDHETIRQQIIGSYLGEDKL